MSEPRPKIVRDKLKKQRSQIQNIVNHFSRDVFKTIRQLPDAEILKATQEANPETLLYFRKALVQQTKKSILERKDQEQLILLYAAIVWHQRLDHDRQIAILEEWG